jgi:hypothetical protein
VNPLDKKSEIFCVVSLRRMSFDNIMEFADLGVWSLWHFPPAVGQQFGDSVNFDRKFDEVKLPLTRFYQQFGKIR